MPCENQIVAPMSRLLPNSLVVSAEYANVRINFPSMLGACQGDNTPVVLDQIDVLFDPDSFADSIVLRIRSSPIDTS